MTNPRPSRPPVQPQGPARLTDLAVRVAEMAASVGLVLLFFLLFLGILGLSFPQGTGLRNLLLLDETPELDRQGGLTQRRGGAPAATDSAPFIARLTSITRRVKDKRASAISWREAQSGIALENRHAVQTFDRSKARIEFDDRNVLNLGQNSLVIVRRMERQRQTQIRRASLVLLDGNVGGRVSDRPDDLMEVEILTGNAVSTIRSAASSETEFKVVSHEDNSASIAVYRGEAEVAGAGRSIIVPSEHVLRVDPQGQFGEPVRLPGVPDLIGPAPRSEYVYRTLPPQVRLEWEPVEFASGYRVEVARDREFDEVLLDKVVPATELVHANLPAGRYYWRVSGSSQGVEGITGRPRAFEVVQDTEPPRLDIDLPDETLHEQVVVLRGVTEPGAEVFIGEQAIAVSSSGTFEFELTLDRGVNVVVVEAFDAAGNVSYVSKQVRAQF